MVPPLGVTDQLRQQSVAQLYNVLLRVTSDANRASTLAQKTEDRVFVKSADYQSYASGIQQKLEVLQKKLQDLQAAAAAGAAPAAQGVALGAGALLPQQAPAVAVGAQHGLAPAPGVAGTAAVPQQQYASINQQQLQFRQQQQQQQLQQQLQFQQLQQRAAQGLAPGGSPFATAGAPVTIRPAGAQGAAAGGAAPPLVQMGTQNSALRGALPSFSDPDFAALGEAFLGGPPPVPKPAPPAPAAVLPQPAVVSAGQMAAPAAMDAAQLAARRTAGPQHQQVLLMQQQQAAAAQRPPAQQPAAAAAAPGPLRQPVVLVQPQQQPGAAAPQLVYVQPHVQMVGGQGQVVMMPALPQLPAGAPRPAGAALAPALAPAGAPGPGPANSSSSNAPARHQHDPVSLQRFMQVVSTARDRLLQPAKEFYAVLANTKADGRPKALAKCQQIAHLLKLLEVTCPEQLPFSVDAAQLDKFMHELQSLHRSLKEFAKFREERERRRAATPAAASGSQASGGAHQSATGFLAMLGSEPDLEARGSGASAAGTPAWAPPAQQDPAAAAAAAKRRAAALLAARAGEAAARAGEAAARAAAARAAAAAALPADPGERLVALLRRAAAAPEETKPAADAFALVNKARVREQQLAAEDAAPPPLPPEAVELLAQAKAAAAAAAAASGGGAAVAAGPAVVSQPVGCADLSTLESVASVEGLGGAEGEERPTKLQRTDSGATPGAAAAAELPPAQAALLARAAAECEAAGGALGGALRLAARAEADGARVVVTCKPSLAGAAGAGSLDQSWQVMSLSLGPSYPQAPPTAVFLSGAKAPAGAAGELAHQCRAAFAVAAARLSPPVTVGAAAAAWAGCVGRLKGQIAVRR
eukprot:scaffold12.g8010.t1